MEGDPVQLTVPALAENVAIVRHALAGLAAALEMEADAIADLKTVVTEACMNVVVHAYEEDGGPLEVRAWPEEGYLAVSVRDYGVGIRPRAEPERVSLRLGLALIAALATTFSISSKPGEGTEVLMRLPLVPEQAREREDARVEPAEGTRVRMPAGDLMAPVLSRIIGMHAARADFSVDRLSDAILLSDAVSYQDAADFPESIAEVQVTESDGAFAIRVGPLRDGGGERLLRRMQIPEIGASLEGLADDVSIESDGKGEFLVLTISQPR
jgi:serine/threonine-protein kinase RsbW